MNQRTYRPIDKILAVICGFAAIVAFAHLTQGTFGRVWWTAVGVVGLSLIAASRRKAVAAAGLFFVAFRCAVGFLFTLQVEVLVIGIVVTAMALLLASRELNDFN